MPVQCATTALVPGVTPAQQWDAIRLGLSRFAGRPLELDDEVYRSESETNQRNRAIARLLESYGRIELDPLAVVDVYTKQCALLVTATDLAVMGATLADGGVNPLTRERVVLPGVCRDTLAILASTGLYERSGEWLFEIGLPEVRRRRRNGDRDARESRDRCLLTTIGFGRQQCPWSARHGVSIADTGTQYLRF